MSATTEAAEVVAIRSCACGKEWLPQADGCPDCDGTGVTVYGADPIIGDLIHGDLHELVWDDRKHVKAWIRGDLLAGARYHPDTVKGGTTSRCARCAGRRRPICPDRGDDEREGCTLRWAASPLAEIADWWPELLDDRELARRRQWAAPEDDDPERVLLRAAEAALERAEKNPLQIGASPAPEGTLTPLVARRAVFEQLPVVAGLTGVHLARTVPGTCARILNALPGLSSGELTDVTMRVRSIIGLVRAAVGTREPVTALALDGKPLACHLCDTRSLRVFQWQGVVRCVNPGCRCVATDCACQQGAGHAWRYDPDPRHDEWGYLARCLGVSEADLDAAA